MGFFKDIHTLNKQGREMQKNMDVKATMANAMASMQAGTAMMQQQTAASMMAVHGADATATIAAVRQTGMQMNFSPVLDVDLMVFRNGIPLPVTVRQHVEQIYLARAQVGASVRVKVDPNNHQSVWIDWVSPA